MKNANNKLHKQLCIESHVRANNPHNDDNNYDFNNPNKKFITFPFAYQNGRLHAGHISTFLKCDILANYYKLHDYNVLLPFGFHATGSPIVACANKLYKELELLALNKSIDLKNPINLDNIDINELAQDSQIKILLSMGIKKNELLEFTKPVKWINYFPKINTEDLKFFGTSINFTRSFITTDHNQHFSAFVKWQFNKLQINNKIKYGKKYIICTLDENNDLQVCSDHDRTDDGEGVKPMKIYLSELIVNDNIILYPVFNKNVIGENDINNFLTNTSFHLILKESNDQKYYIPTNHFNGIIYQMDFLINDHVILDMNVKVECDILVKNSNVYHDYYIPEKQVISREGSNGFVALIWQYFIDYADPEWKNLVQELSNDINCFNEKSKQRLNNGINILHEWAFSRSKKTTIGTSFDDSYVIDSLSDSTIYMAYYTIADKFILIPEQIIADETICNKIFDYIFCDGDACFDLLDHFEIINQCRKEYLYWYPQDIRISGVDLIGNHLTMSLFNHSIVLGTKTLPKSYYINGHLMLNGKKMSKSKGIFVLLSEMMEKYGCDATRYALIQGFCTTENSLDNSNFTDSNASNAIVAIDAERESMMQLVNLLINNSYGEQDFIDNDLDFLDNVFLSLMNHIRIGVNKSYENLNYQNVLKLCFVDLVSSKNNYLIYTNKLNLHLIKYYIDLHLLLLHPCIPYYVKHLWSVLKNNNFKTITKFNELKEYTPNYKIIFQHASLQKYLNQIHKSLSQLEKRHNKFKNVCDPKNITLTLQIYDFTEVHLNIINNTGNNLSGEQLKFKNYITNLINSYGSDILDSDEEAVAVLWLQKLYNVKAGNFCIKNFIIKKIKSQNINQYPWNGTISLK